MFPVTFYGLLVIPLNQVKLDMLTRSFMYSAFIIYALAQKNAIGRNLHVPALESLKALKLFNNLVHARYTAELKILRVLKL